MAQNPFGSFEDALEQGISNVKSATGNQVKTTLQAASSQITGQTQKSASGQPGDGHQSPAHADSSGQDSMHESTPGAQNPSQTHTSTDPLMNPNQFAQLNAQKEAEQKQKLEAARRQFHAEYFKRLTTPSQEPSKRDKLDQEEQEEKQKKMAEIEEQKKKDEPIALSRAKRGTEMNRGASG